MNSEDAIKIVGALNDASRCLNQAILLAADAMSEVEFASFKKKVGACMGEIFIELIMPFHQELPSSIPKELKEGYERKGYSGEE